MTQRASKLILLLAFTALLGSCSLADEFKALAKEAALAVPFEHLDSSLQTLYALREGNVAKAIETQETSLALLLAAAQLTGGQNLSFEQQKTLKLAAAYLTQYPPKELDRAKQ